MENSAPDIFILPSSHFPPYLTTLPFFSPFPEKSLPFVRFTLLAMPRSPLPRTRFSSGIIINGLQWMEEDGHVSINTSPFAFGGRLSLSLRAPGFSLPAKDKRDQLVYGSEEEVLISAFEVSSRQTGVPYKYLPRSSSTPPIGFARFRTRAWTAKLAREGRPTWLTLNCECGSIRYRCLH